MGECAFFRGVRRRWRVVLLRAKGEILGRVEAPDAQAAKLSQWSSSIWTKSGVAVAELAALLSVWGCREGALRPTTRSKYRVLVSWRAWPLRGTFLMKLYVRHDAGVADSSVIPVCHTNLNAAWCAKDGRNDFACSSFICGTHAYDGAERHFEAYSFMQGPLMTRSSQ